jgi:hypothetical protein
MPRNVKAGFCERYGCAPDEFERRVFWRCLYRHALPLAGVIWACNPEFFKTDLQAIRLIGTATSAREVLAEVNSLRDDPRTRSRFLRESLRIRISGKRLLRLAAAVLHHGNP